MSKAICNIRSLTEGDCATDQDRYHLAKMLALAGPAGLSNIIAVQESCATGSKSYHYPNQDIEAGELVWVVMPEDKQGCGVGGKVRADEEGPLNWRIILVKADTAEIAISMAKDMVYYCD